MNIAVFTLTRDRLKYTRTCFGALHAKAGISFDHWVLDNGSTDGTREWLFSKSSTAFGAPDIRWLMLLDKNMGISIGCNLVIKDILEARPRYDIVVKFDNDCFPLTDGFLRRIAEAALAADGVVSPWVEGITNKPPTSQPVGIGGEAAYRVNHCGGLCRAAVRRAHEDFTYPETLPMASGQDSAFSSQAVARGFPVFYLCDARVEHYLGTKGQEADPDMAAYFQRKYVEERTPPQ